MDELLAHKAQLAEIEELLEEDNENEELLIIKSELLDVIKMSEGESRMYCRLNYEMQRFTAFSILDLLNIRQQAEQKNDMFSSMFEGETKNAPINIPKVAHESVSFISSSKKRLFEEMQEDERGLSSDSDSDTYVTVPSLHYLCIRTWHTDICFLKQREYLCYK